MQSNHHNFIFGITLCARFKGQMASIMVILHGCNSNLKNYFEKLNDSNKEYDSFGRN